MVEEHYALEIPVVKKGHRDNSSDTRRSSYFVERGSMTARRLGMDDRRLRDTFR
jgi:hypothetical protein